MTPDAIEKKEGRISRFKRGVINRALAISLFSLAACSTGVDKIIRPTQSPTLEQFPASLRLEATNESQTLQRFANTFSLTSPTHGPLVLDSRSVAAADAIDLTTPGDHSRTIVIAPGVNEGQIPVADTTYWEANLDGSFQRVSQKTDAGYLIYVASDGETLLRMHRVPIDQAEQFTDEQLLQALGLQIMGGDGQWYSAQITREEFDKLVPRKVNAVPAPLNTATPVPTLIATATDLPPTWTPTPTPTDITTSEPEQTKELEDIVHTYNGAVIALDPTLQEIVQDITLDSEFPKAEENLQEVLLLTHMYRSGLSREQVIKGTKYPVEINKKTYTVDTSKPVRIEFARRRFPFSVMSGLSFDYIVEKDGSLTVMIQETPEVQPPQYTDGLIMALMVYVSDKMLPTGVNYAIGEQAWKKDNPTGERFGNIIIPFMASDLAAGEYNPYPNNRILKVTLK